MFKNNRINSFLTLAETLSYTKTAKLLYMSQQAVSRCIASLEAELDTQLFIRTTRSVELTPTGRKYYDLYSELNQLYDDKMSQLKQETDGENYRKVKIGIQSYMDVMQIQSIIAKMKVELPCFTIQVAVVPPSVMLDQFQRDLFDIAILLGRFLPDDFNANRLELVSNPLYLMVSSKNPKATDDAGFEDFMDIPYISDILEGEDNLAHNARMQREFEMWGLVPGEIVWAYDRDSALMYAELGHGIVIDSDRSRLIEGRDLKKYNTGKYESLLLLYKEEKTDSPEMKHLLNAFQYEYSLTPEKILSRGE